MKGVFIIQYSVPTQDYIKTTFQALTDAILPPGLPSEYGYISKDMGVHEYLIYALNHYVAIQQQLYQITISLSLPTAKLLDAAAKQLVSFNQIKPTNEGSFSGGGIFSSLSRKDRLQTLSALENLQLDLYSLPEPFRNNAGFIKHVIDALNRFSMFGYYSEWPAYGSTRLYPPQLRRLEFFPWGWEQVGYPGVAYGYRDFRGFLLRMSDIERRFEHEAES
ncbi:gluconate 2-dehydrogenase subunit 3 family protein [Oceanobacillus sp. CAU 1775]